MNENETLSFWISGARDLHTKNAKNTPEALSLIAEIQRIVRRVISLRQIPPQVYSVDRSATTWTKELLEDVTQEVILGLLKKKQFAFLSQDNGYFVNLGGFRSVLKKQVFQTILDIQIPTIEGNLSERAVKIMSEDPFVSIRTVDGRSFYELRNQRGFQRELDDQLVQIAANIVIPNREKLDHSDDSGRLPRIMTDHTLSAVLEQICLALLCPIDRPFLDRVFRYALHDLVPSQESIEELEKTSVGIEGDDENIDNWLNNLQPTEYQIDEKYSGTELLEHKFSSSETIWKELANLMASIISEDPKLAGVFLGGVAGLRQIQIATNLGVTPGRVTQLMSKLNEKMSPVRTSFISGLDYESLKEFNLDETQQKIMLMIAAQLNLMGYKI